MANADNTGAAAAAGYSVCPSDLVTATITENANHALDPTVAYNYGVTSLYFRVTVQNFTGAWNLSVNRSALSALIGAGETFTMAWGITAAGATNVIADDNPVSIAEQTPATATDQETIMIKVTYTHNTYEGTTLKTLPLIANATDQAGNPDVSATCAPEVDTVTQILNARPNPVTATTATPNTFIQP